ncbi:MAG: nuclear transport factor 2 family protein [Anaerolineae bacterium]|nr:nuclear transport factor 2 family protein [Anaerolineae bacterium]
MKRTTQELIEHHMEVLVAGNMDELLADYGDDAVLMTLDGTAVGIDAIRVFFQNILDTMPNLEATTRNLRAYDDLVLIDWSADCDTVTITDGTDTFVIRDDKIVRQTAWFKAVPK